MAKDTDTPKDAPKDPLLKVNVLKAIGVDGVDYPPGSTVVLSKSVVQAQGGDYVEVIGPAGAGEKQGDSPKDKQQTGDKDK